MRAAKVRGGSDRSVDGQTKIDSRGGTLILAGEDIVSIAVKRFPMQHSGQRPAGLGTDSDIGGMGSRGSSERRLQKVSVCLVSCLARVFLVVCIVFFCSWRIFCCYFYLCIYFLGLFLFIDIFISFFLYFFCVRVFVCVFWFCFCFCHSASWCCPFYVCCFWVVCACVGAQRLWPGWEFLPCVFVNGIFLLCVVIAFCFGLAVAGNASVAIYACPGASRRACLPFYDCHIY